VSKGRIYLMFVKIYEKDNWIIDDTNFTDNLFYQIYQTSWDVFECNNFLPWLLNRTHE
jgi:hypothetical protein